MCCDCHTPRRWLFFSVFWDYLEVRESNTFTQVLCWNTQVLKSALGWGLDPLPPVLLPRACQDDSTLTSKVRWSYLQTLPRGLTLTLLTLPSGGLEGCSSSLQTEHPRCFKNHKWALNCSNLPARARTERGKNNQHQFCQPSSLCLLGCSQLTQIQLLSKLDERPHNCLDDTFFARCSLLLHPWAVAKDRTAAVISALRGDKHKHKNKKTAKISFQNPPMKTAN